MQLKPLTVAGIGSRKARQEDDEQLARRLQEEGEAWKQRALGATLFVHFHGFVDQLLQLTKDSHALVDAQGHAVQLAKYSNLFSTRFVRLFFGCARMASDEAVWLLWVVGLNCNIGGNAVRYVGTASGFGG